MNLNTTRSSQAIHLWLGTTQNIRLIIAKLKKKQETYFFSIIYVNIAFFMNFKHL